MAVKKQTRVWNGMTVDSFTDTDTGKITLKTPPREVSGGVGVSLAESGPDGKWTVTNELYFRRQYNNELKKQGKQPLSKEEFNTAFYADGANKFNNDRAAALNNVDNYSSESEYEQKTAAHAESGVPLVENAETGEKNNSKGENAGYTLEELKEKGESVLESLDIPKEKDVNHTTTNYRYPLGAIPDLGYDFVQFIAHEYDPKGPQGLLRDSGFGARRETVTLPIMPNIEDTSSTNWGEDTMNFLQEAAGNLALSTLSRVKKGNNIGKIMQGAFADLQQVGSGLLKDPTLKDAIVGYFAGQASGTNVLARGQGVVINPNLELLFKGPALRTFSFNFKLRPRDDGEAEVCKNIIRSFKKNMNPRRSSGNIFLHTPSVFKIEYFFNGKPHPSMNRIKMCALTSFRVNYTPDGAYMTYGDGQVTGYDISLSFSEVFPVYADDQDSAAALTGVGF